MRLPFLLAGRISPHTGYSAPRVFLFYFTDFPLSRFSSCLPVDIYTLCKTGLRRPLLQWLSYNS